MLHLLPPGLLFGGTPVPIADDPLVRMPGDAFQAWSVSPTAAWASEVVVWVADAP